MWRRVMESVATLQESVLINAERGEYGGRPIGKEIESRTQMLLTSLEGRVERVRPNGTVLENRNRSLPSGGYVMVYTHVTETKRNDAAVRQSERSAERGVGTECVGPRRCRWSPCP